IPSDHAIKGFGGAVLFSTNAAKTMEVLEHVLGLAREAEDAGYVRFRAAGDTGSVVDIDSSDLEWGAGGAGTVHHIAWRAADFAQHEQWRSAVAEHGYQPTAIIDRQYFNAIYFRESGGILFEIATDPPGFANDEEADALGHQLMLPEWLESKRPQIEANLLPIQVRELEVN
ncbi:VOC family protein, partial [Paenibacillus sepulcri]|nr:VOC family protein [Paenibacillus sepulcri]